MLTWDSSPRCTYKQQQCYRCIRIPESQESLELQELRQNIVKYSHFAAKIRKTVRFRFRVRVLIRFTCDSYVYACVVYCILRYSDVIPVIPMIPVIPVFVCTRNVTALTVHTRSTFVDLRLRGTTCIQVFTQRMDLITDVGKTEQRQLF